MTIFTSISCSYQSNRSSCHCQDLPSIPYGVCGDIEVSVSDSDEETELFQDCIANEEEIAEWPGLEGLCQRIILATKESSDKADCDNNESINFDDVDFAIRLSSDDDIPSDELDQDVE